MIYYFRWLASIIAIPLIIIYGINIIYLYFSKQKVSYSANYFFNISLVLFDISLLLMIMFNDYQRDGLELTDWMQILFSPILLLFIMIYLIKKILKFIKGKEKLNQITATSFIIICTSIIISTFLVTYYLPSKNLIYSQINKLNIIEDNGNGTTMTIDTYDPQKIDSMVKLINKHTFKRSIGIQFSQIKHKKDFSISLTTKGVTRFSLDIYDNKSIILEIDEHIYQQIYMVQAEEELSQEILALISDLKKTPEAIQDHIQMSTDQTIYRLPIIGVSLTIANNGYQDVRTQQSCIIELYENEHWEAIKNGEIKFKDFNDGFHTISSNWKRSYFIPLESHRDALKPGKYRIVKTFKSLKEEFNATCEFTLE